MFVPWDLPHFRLDINNILFHFLVNTDAVIKSRRCAQTELRVAITIRTKKKKEAGLTSGRRERNKEKKLQLNKTSPFDLQNANTLF